MVGPRRSELPNWYAGTSVRGRRLASSFRLMAILQNLSKTSRVRG